jgi:hypothetical protein
MRRVLTFEAQVKIYGGHSRAVRHVLRSILKEDETGKPREGATAVPSPVTLRPGTYLVREWNGRPYRVEVTENGFVMDGKADASLSAIAQKITGTIWSGPRFFGLARA